LRIYVHLLKRGLLLFVTVVVAIYATILIVNMGGYIDEIIKSQLLEDITNLIKRDPIYRTLTPAEQDKLIKARYESELERRGLNQPFIIRSLIYLKDAITLDLGRSLYITSNTGSRRVQTIILELLPTSVMLFTTGTVLSFIITLYLGLYLSRHRGGLLDKIVVALSPSSGIPPWLYGIVFIIIFSSYLHIFPYGGLVSVPPPNDPVLYFLDALWHMTLPLICWILSGLFLGAYGNRNYFLLFSSEDYVTVGKAKGLPESAILRRYVLRPSSSPIILGLALGLIGSWQGAIITETVFNWPGIGLLTNKALTAVDTPIIIGLAVTYGYLLAATEFILEILYSYLDPRIRVLMG